MAKLEIKEITKAYPTRTDPLQILNGVSASLSSAENLAVVGPSGSGKSTFMYIVGTLDQPTSGSVQLDGVDPFRLSEKQLARFRNDNIGFVFQEHHLLPQLTVMENVLVPELAFGRASAASVDRAKELVERVGLGKRKEHRPAELSGGERQRVAVARALLRQPMLLLADEPTGSLDQATASGIGELLLELNDQEQTILITVTHSTQLAEQFQSVVLLNGGYFEKYEPESAATSSMPPVGEQPAVEDASAGTQGED